MPPVTDLPSTDQFATQYGAAKDQKSGITWPGIEFHDIVEDVQFPQGACRGIYIGTAGNLTVTDYKGTTVTFKNLPAGVILPIRVDLVTGATTAADLIAIY